ADPARQAADIVLERRLPIKVLGTDWQFDGSSVTVFYSQTTDDRVDLGELSQTLEAHFGTRVQLQRLGARDETKVMTGVGTCGREVWSGSCGTSGCATTQGANVVKESIVVELATGGRAEYTAQELGVSFSAIPAHTRGVGTYGSDEVPRQERPTPVKNEGGQPRRRRRG